MLKSSKSAKDVYFKIPGILKVPPILKMHRILTPLAFDDILLPQLTCKHTCLGIERISTCTSERYDLSTMP